MNGPERERLRQARVAIAGAGGLGSNVAMHLVRSGVGRLILADFDRVAVSNLNRQFYFADQVGMLKVEALRINLLRIDPAVELLLHPEAVTAENAFAWFGEADCVVEAFDRSEMKWMLAQALQGAKMPVVGASGIAGIGDSNRMKVNRIGSRFYLAGDGDSACTEEQLPWSPRVGIAAAMQANTVLALLLNQGV